MIYTIWKHGDDSYSMAAGTEPPTFVNGVLTEEVNTSLKTIDTDSWEEAARIYLETIEHDRTP